MRREYTPTADDQRLLMLFEIAKIPAAGHDLDTLVPELLSCLIQRLGAADAVLAAALGFSAQKMGLKGDEAALPRLQTGEPETRGYFECGLSKSPAEHISALDKEVEAVYAGFAPKHLVLGGISLQRSTKGGGYGSTST